MWKPLALASILLLAMPPIAFAAPRSEVNDWSDERGKATAQQVISSCLKTGPNAREANVACVNAPFEACIREYGGHENQYDMNVCRRYSYEAWAERYDSTLAGFDKLFQNWRKPAADKWQQATATRFGGQEESWRHWVAADCEMWELGSVGGSIHSLALVTCEERHIALRTLELTPLLDWFQSR